MSTLTRPRPATAPAVAPRRPDRLALLWLLVGTALLCVGSFATVVPLAAWLGPVFLLRFSRSRRPLVALPLVAVAGWVSVVVGLRGAFPLADLALFALGGATMILTYGADRLLAPRLGPVAGTLVFPAADVGVAFLTALASGGLFATWGSPAYAQAADLPLVQVVAVTGIWGLHALVAWAAPVANTLWERGFDLHAARAVVVPFAAVLALALVAGGARLAFDPPAAATVRVAAIAPDRELSRAALAAGDGSADATERARVRAELFEPVADDLLAATRAAAAGGAEIVAWSEAAAPTFPEDEAALLDRAGAVARDEGVWLSVGLLTLLPTERPAVENRAVLIGPDGEVASDYAKSTVVLADGNEPGPGVVPVVDTPHGRLATIICFDADLPWLARQAGRAGADILLVPSRDWAPIAETHARMATLRAVENGVALVRPAGEGVSLAADAHGRLRGYRADFFVADDHTLLTDVPTRGTWTPYRFVGEGVAMAAVLTLLALAVVALARRRP